MAGSAGGAGGAETGSSKCSWIAIDTTWQGRSIPGQDQDKAPKSTTTTFMAAENGPSQVAQGSQRGSTADRPYGTAQEPRQELRHTGQVRAETNRDRERERETERDRERQRETERDRERQRETERDREARAETETKAERGRERQRQREREREPQVANSGSWGESKDGVTAPRQS